MTSGRIDSGLGRTGPACDNFRHETKFGAPGHPRTEQWRGKDQNEQTGIRVGTGRLTERDRNGIDWTMTETTGLSRRALLGIFAATAVTAAPRFANAFAFNRGAGDIRRLQMYSGRTGERVDAIYWVDGDYIPEVLAEINHFFRDWRNDQVHAIDVRTLDMMAASHRLLRADQPYMLLSGFRSPQTNAALRARSRNVARNSLHLVGKAADLRLRGRSVAQVARAATALGAGGVGRYSRSDFTHMDSGPVRSWGA